MIDTNMKRALNSAYGSMCDKSIPTLQWAYEGEPIARVEDAPIVITICGAMKFSDEMKAQEKILAKAGYIVLMPILGETVESHEELEIYRKAHIEKIKMSNAILVINKDGYVGRHTANEIEAASRMRKRIYFLENADK